MFLAPCRRRGTFPAGPPRAGCGRGASRRRRRSIPFNLDRASRRVVEPPRHRGLAGAAGADEGHRRAARHDEVKVADDADARAVLEVHVLEATRTCPPRPRRRGRRACPAASPTPRTPAPSPPATSASGSPTTRSETPAGGAAGRRSGRRRCRRRPPAPAGAAGRRTRR